MRLIHYVILGLSALLPACASSPVRCDGHLQPVNSPIASPKAALPAAPGAGQASQRSSP